MQPALARPRAALPAALLCTHVFSSNLCNHRAVLAAQQFWLVAVLPTMLVALQQVKQCGCCLPALYRLADHLGAALPAAT